MVNDIDYEDYERALKFEERISSMPILQSLTYTIIDELDPKETDRVLDVGTGTGRLGMALSSLIPKGVIVGIDSGYAMLRIAREKILRHKTDNLRLVQGRAEALPFLSQSYDAACFILSFHHFHDSETALREVFRVLDIGAQVVSLDPVLKEAKDENEERLNEIIEEAFQQAHGPEFRFFTATQIRDLFEGVGFSVEICEIHDYPFHQKGVEEIPMGPHWLQAYELLLQKGEERLISKFEQNYFAFELIRGRFTMKGKMSWVVVKAIK